MSIIVNALVFQIILRIFIGLRKWFNAYVTQRLVLWLTTSQFISSHEGPSGHPQVQVTFASANQPEYSQRGRTSAWMMCWMRAHWADPERLWQAFSTLCPCWTSMPTSRSHWRQHYCRPFPRSFHRNNIHPAGIRHLSSPSPRYSRNIHTHVNCCMCRHRLLSNQRRQSRANALLKVE